MPTKALTRLKYYGVCIRTNLALYRLIDRFVAICNASGNTLPLFIFSSVLFYLFPICALNTLSLLPVMVKVSEDNFKWLPKREK